MIKEARADTDLGTNSDKSPSDEIKLLQRECREMVKLLKQLERQELTLLQQSKILAREALSCGYQSHLLEPPAPKRRRTTATATGATNASQSSHSTKKKT